MLHRNVPTTSDRSAMLEFGKARNRERDELISLVHLRPGMTVLDVQAAGGYLSDEVHQRLEGRVRCICVEPSDALRERLNPAFVAVGDPVEHFASIADGSVDVVLGLAALHHSESHADTLRECFRVLKPGGELAVCDVQAGSSLAAWFDDYVHRHNPAGHQGRFPAAGEMSTHLRACGFESVREEPRDVPWSFGRRDDIAVFFRGLFGLQPALPDIDRALDLYFRIATTPQGVDVDWQLIYAYGAKPPSA